MEIQKINKSFNHTTLTHVIALDGATYDDAFSKLIACLRVLNAKGNTVVVCTWFACPRRYRSSSSASMKPRSANLVVAYVFAHPGAM